MSAPRSYLYVPGDQPRMLAKAWTRGADAVIFDLEDAVPPVRKADARAAVVDALATPRAGVAVVRVNAGSDDDLAALRGRAIDAISLPKAEVASVRRVAETLPGIAIMPLVETAAGVLELAEQARQPGVVRLQLGEADLAVALGIEPSDDGREFASIRSQVVVASAAAGIDAPVAPVSTTIDDAAAVRASTHALRRMGFGGRAAIHPAQLEPIHDAFTPSADELAEARDVVARFEAAGGGVVVDARGRMVDAPIVAAARRTIARART